MDHCVCNRSKWLIVCKNHLEFYAIKILLHLPFSWFALNLGKIGRDDVVKGPNASKKIAFYQFIHMTGKMASHTILGSESNWVCYSKFRFKKGNGPFKFIKKTCRKMVIFDLPTIQYHIAWIQITISSIDIFLSSKNQIKVMIQLKYFFTVHDLVMSANAKTWEGESFSP